MDSFLEKMLGKFDLSEEVVLTIEKNGKESYLRGHIEDVQEKYLLVATSTSLVRISPDTITRIAKPQPAATPKKKISTKKTDKTPKSEKVQDAQKKGAVKSSNQTMATPVKHDTSLNQNTTNTVSVTKPKPETAQQPMQKQETLTADKEDSKSPLSPSLSQEKKKIKLPLPPMGYISDILGTNIRIVRNDGGEMLVSKELVIDKGLIKEINALATQGGKDLHLPILWSTLGKDVLCVIGRLSPEQVNSRINTFRDGENYRAALSLAELLCQYSNYPIYTKQLSKMQKLCGQGSDSDGVVDVKLSFYENGAKLMKEGKLKDAINCFFQSLNKGENANDSLKGIVSAYTIDDNIKEAFEVIQRYGMLEFRDPFKCTAKNYIWARNWLVNHGMWAECLDLIQNRLNHLTNVDDVQKSKYFSQMATCYLKMEGDNATKSAEELYRRALELDPNNRDAKTSLQEITGEFMATSASVDSLEGSRFTSSLLTIHDKDIYLDGQPSQQLADRLEEEYKQLNFQSYDERAKVQLQRAKVEAKLNPDKNEQRNILLSLYLTFYAQGGYKKGVLEKDSLRFLLCESISVRGDKLQRSSISRVLDSMSIFFNTFVPNKELVFRNAQKMVDILDSRNLYQDDTFYEQVSSLMQYRYPFNRLTDYFYNSQYQVSAKDYLSTKGYELGEGFSKEAFVSAWNDLILSKRKKITIVQQLMDKAARSDDFDELYTRYNEFNGLRQEYIEVLGELDMKRIAQVGELLTGALLEYFHSDDPGTKQRRYKDSLDIIGKLVHEYTEAPTRFSFDSLVAILDKSRAIMEDDFMRLISSSKPQLSIDTIGDCSADEDTNEVVFQIVISNKSGCMPATNFALKVKPTTEIIEQKSGFETNYNPINGGSSRIVQQTILVKPEVIEKGALGFEVELTYKNVAVPDEQKLGAKLSLEFEDEEERIKNPYSVCTGSPISQQNEDMFYGRWDYIGKTADAIMNISVPKQIIIYGQRRSGKTSVLNFLKSELQKRGAFCIEFSLENLGKDIRVTGSSDIFFAFIMARIADAVQRIPENDRPEFKYAKGEYYKNSEKLYPEYCQSFEVASKFTNDIADLHSSFEAVPRWKGCKIVLLMDEFTNVYTLIKSGLLPDTVMKQWKAVTQDERVHFSSVMIGQDSTPFFMAEPYASNAFGVIDADRLDYLPEDGARDLIVEPLRNKGKSRFLNRAVERIMELTACNPYFLMNFCSRLVEYMNKKKKGKVTEVDVDNALLYYFNDTEKGFKDDMFHSLYSAVDVTEEEKQKTKTVLMAIAKGMESKDLAALTPDWIVKQLAGEMDAHDIKEILADLNRRDVAPLKDGRQRIKVLMFQKWLTFNSGNYVN